MKKVFSIIVPIYNVEKYLDECVTSLVNQNYDKNKYEIILVDDGSPDNCPKMCDDYSLNYLNITTIHKKNGGLSDSRNCGIKAAKGDYLLFIDSDDYIDNENFLNEIDAIIKENNPDLIVFGRKKYFEKTQTFGDAIKLEIKNDRKIIYPMIEQTFFRASACDKIIKRKIVVDNNLFFKVGMIAEDIEWCGKVIENIELDKIKSYNENVYVYRQRVGSITKTLKAQDLEKLIDMFTSMYKIKDDERTYIINSYLAYEYCVCLGNASLSKNLSKEYKVKLYKMKNLLNYDVSKKVKKVKFMKNLIGIKFTSKLLGIVIKIKNK